MFGMHFFILLATNHVIG